MIFHADFTEITNKYNFVKLFDDGLMSGVELYADHHMLSSLRKCEGYFVESILNRSFRGRAWFFDFGIWIHECVEYMYTYYLKNQEYCSVPQLVDFGALRWNQLKIPEYHRDNKNYIKMGGFSGASKLLLDYWRNYGQTREPYKIIGTELPFGRDKEVYLGEIEIGGQRVRCYYSGRIDIIADDGYSLLVLDTKSANRFSGDESDNFNPHEGMMGYVYALREIVKKNFPSIQKPANRVVINHISVADVKDYRERFKRTPITYSYAQLDEWRVRQLRTFKRLYELSVLGETADWNTDTCNNMYFSDCAYKGLHRLDAASREIVRKGQYITIEPWNPYRED